MRLELPFALLLTAVGSLPMAAQAPAAVPQPSEIPPIIVPQGPHARFGTAMVLGPGASLTVEDSKADRNLTLQLDGNNVSPDVWRSGWTAGHHQAVAMADTPAGPHVSTLPFIFDATPPKIEWQRGHDPLYLEHGLDQGMDAPTVPRRTRTHRHIPLLWSPDGRRWLPLVPRRVHAKDGILASWPITSDRPQAFIYARKDHAFPADLPIALDHGQTLRLWATDAESAVAKLEVAVTESPDGYALQVTATDLVGNVARRSWPLAATR